MVGTIQMVATAVVLIALAISWTSTGIAMAAPEEQRLDERTEDRLAMLEVRLAHLVSSLKTEELLSKVEAVLRKLEEKCPTTSDTLSSTLRAMEAESTTSSRIEKGLARLEERSVKTERKLESIEEGLARMEEKTEEKNVRIEEKIEEKSIVSRIPEEKMALGKALWEAARDGSAQDVQRLLHEGADLHYRDENSYNRTPLHIAAANDHVDAVALLLAAGADVNSRDNIERTPLQEATWWGKDAAMQMLIAAGADVNIQNKNDQTPLYFAVWRGHVAAAQALIAAGAEVNRQDKSGWTPLHWAALNGDKETVKALIAAGARKDIQDKYEKTPYDMARSSVRDLL